jgi:hypothetical protein
MGRCRGVVRPFFARWNIPGRRRGSCLRLHRGPRGSAARERPAPPCCHAANASKPAAPAASAMLRLGPRDGADRPLRVGRHLLLAYRDLQRCPSDEQVHHAIADEPDPAKEIDNRSWSLGAAYGHATAQPPQQGHSHSEVLPTRCRRQPGLNRRMVTGGPPGFRTCPGSPWQTGTRFPCSTRTDRSRHRDGDRQRRWRARGPTPRTTALRMFLTVVPNVGIPRRSRRDQ